MSQFLCPLCGRHVSLAKYDPSDYEVDIIAVEKRGLGRGKGFEEVSRYSMLESDDVAMTLLKERVAVLYKLLHEEESNAWAVDIESLTQENQRLRMRVDELLAALEDMVREEAEAEALEAEMESILAKINQDFRTEYVHLDGAVDFLLEVCAEG